MAPLRSDAASHGRISPLLGAVIAYQALNVGALALISLFLSGMHEAPYEWMAPVSAVGAAALTVGGARLVRDRRLGVVLICAGFVLAALVFAQLVVVRDTGPNLYAIGSIGLSLMGLALVAWRPALRGSA